MTLRKNVMSTVDTEPPAVSRALHKKEGEHFISNDQGK